jgi:hypothetical protein
MTLQSYQPGNWMRDGHESSTRPEDRDEVGLRLGDDALELSQYGVAAEGLVPCGLDPVSPVPKS